MPSNTARPAGSCAGFGTWLEQRPEAYGRRDFSTIVLGNILLSVAVTADAAGASVFASVVDHEAADALAAASEAAGAAAAGCVNGTADSSTPLIKS